MAALLLHAGSIHSYKLGRTEGDAVLAMLMLMRWCTPIPRAACRHNDEAGARTPSHAFQCYLDRAARGKRLPLRALDWFSSASVSVSTHTHTHAYVCCALRLPHSRTCVCRRLTVLFFYPTAVPALGEPAAFDAPPPPKDDKKKKKKKK